jgi:hypothetical protein
MLIPFLLIQLCYASLTDCNVSSILRPTFLSATPEVPKHNQNLTFVVNAAVPDPVAWFDATYSIVSAYNEWTALNITEPVTTPLFQNSSWTYTFAWPTRMSGAFVTDIRLNINGENYLCLHHETIIPWF